MYDKVHHPSKFRPLQYNPTILTTHVTIMTILLITRILIEIPEVSKLVEKL